MASTVSVPTLRYGCAPHPYGQRSCPTFVAVVCTERPLVGERVLDAEVQGERIPGLGMERELHDDPIGLAFGDAPDRPADEAVDRVRALGLGERELVVAPVELVLSVLEPVRPRDQHLSATGGRHLVDAVAVHHVATSDGIDAQPGSDLGDDRPLVPELDLDLLARRRDFGHPGGECRAAGLGLRPATTKDHRPIATAIAAANA